MSPSPSTVTASRGRMLLAGVAGLAGLLVVWAAAAPRPPVVLPGLREGTEVPPPPREWWMPNYLPGDSSPRNTTTASAVVSDTVAAVIAWLLVILIAAAVVVLGMVVVRALLRAWRARDVPPPEDTGTAGVVPAAVLADQAERLAALGSGTPREGIVAAWARLEASIAIAGVPLLRSRTSTEVVLATLRSHDVPADTLEELAALYREARYSPHELTETDRRRAEDALRRVDAELERHLGLAEVTGGDGG